MEQLWEAKQGRAKGNEQKAEYAQPDEADGKPAVDEGEERRGRKEPEPGRRANCEAKRSEGRKEEAEG